MHICSEPYEDILIKLWDTFKEEAIKAPTAEVYNIDDKLALIPVFYYYATYTCKSQEALVLLNNLINESLENLPESIIFSSGRAGAYLGYHFLYRNNLLDLGDYQALTCGARNMPLYLGLFEESQNFDFLHGGLGVLYSMIVMERDLDLEKTSSFLEALKRKLCDGDCPSFGYDFLKEKPILDKTDLGLAHGLASIILFCSYLFKKSICPAITEAIVLSLTDWMLAKMKTPEWVAKHGVSFFPYSLYSNTDPDEQNSRLAWCYGDLGIGYALLYAGDTFASAPVRTAAIQILNQCATRYDPKDTEVRDAGFCHGASGVAHLFHKAWELSGEATFKNARDSWMVETRKYLMMENGLYSFKKFNPNINAYEENHSMLQGTAGVALVLFSYVTKDFGWDAFFFPAAPMAEKKEA